ncbi:MAG: SCO family protein [Kiloniellales bacterium]|nr:SCO family protein [Kiloniellales bacterium]
MRPDLRPKGAALLLSLVLIFAMSPLAPAQLPFGGPFQLTDHHGTRVSDESYRGKIMLITFGYTYCPDICPTALGTMSDALDLLGEEGQEVQPIFITVDPARDDKDTLSVYIGHFHENFVGLTGSHEDITEAVRAFRVHVRAVPAADAPEGELGEDYLVDHSSFYYLVDRNGDFLSLLPHQTTPEMIAETLRKYL